MKKKNVSLHANKGWGSVYVILLLNFTLTLVLFQSQRMLSLKHMIELDLKYEEAEIVAIKKIKDDFVNFKEEDSTITHQGMDISFDYEGLLVHVEIKDALRSIHFQVEYDDLDNCIISFAYLD